MYWKFLVISLLLFCVCVRKGEWTPKSIHPPPPSVKKKPQFLAEGSPVSAILTVDWTHERRILHFSEHIRFLFSQFSPSAILIILSLEMRRERDCLPHSNKCWRKNDSCCTSRTRTSVRRGGRGGGGGGGGSPFIWVSDGEEDTCSVSLLFSPKMGERRRSTKGKKTSRWRREEEKSVYNYPQIG